MRVAFTWAPARHARGQMLVRVRDDGDFKVRAHRLCDYLNGRWSNRERGYVMSPRKVEKLRELYRRGFDATVLPSFGIRELNAKRG